MAGHRTAYLWEEVWERHSWLEILGRYCIAEHDKKKQIRRLVFPSTSSSRSPGCCSRPCSRQAPAGAT